MENELKAVVINLQKIVKSDTGEVLTKVGYMTQLDQTDRFVGYSVLDAWSNGTAYDKLKEYLGKEVTILIGLKGGRNNSLSTYIKKIDNIKL